MKESASWITLRQAQCEVSASPQKPQALGCRGSFLPPHSFAMRGINAAGRNDYAAHNHPDIGNGAEHEITEDHGPDQLHISVGRKR
jgi:hypothetical protein